LQTVWMVLALMGGLFILGDSLGYAAWNGVNFVMILYLILSLAGSLGLVAALTKSTSKRPLSAWIGGLSALVIAGVALVFLWGFLFGRNSSVPLNESVEMFGIHGPLLAFYTFTICSSSIQILLSIFKYRQLKTLR